MVEEGVMIAATEARVQDNQQQRNLYLRGRYITVGLMGCPITAALNAKTKLPDIKIVQQKQTEWEGVTTDATDGVG